MTAWVRSLDSRLNPIVVKELRQISRGKFLPVILIGFLFTQLSITGAATFFGSAEPGPDLYWALLGFLTGICYLLIPAYAGFRLAQERSDLNKDLLFITTLRPASIVLGKTLSAAVLAALIYSVCMPFIVMTYMLRGIDLLSAFLTIALSYLCTLTAIQAGILIGSLPLNRFIKAIIGLLGLVLGVFLYISFLARAVDRLPVHRGAAEAFEAAFKFLWLWGLPSVGFFLLSAAFIAPPSANRAFALRVYFTAAWAASCIAAFVFDKINGDFNLIIGWFVFSVAGFGLAAVSFSERDVIGQRIRQKIPRSRIRRALAFLFYSGSGGGFLWASVGIVMTYLLWSCAFAASSGRMSSEDFLGYLNGYGFVSLNAWSAAIWALFLHRKFLRNRVSSGCTWLIAVGVYILSNLLWAMFAIGDETYRYFDFIELLPWILAVGAAAGEESLPTVIAGAIALVSICACIPWIARQASAFKPLPLKTSETQGA